MTAQQQAEAQAQANQANAALAARTEAEQRHQFDLRTGALSQSRRTREDAINAARQRRFDEQISGLDPFARAGRQAVGEQSKLLGLSGAPAQAEAFERFTESPGQAFLRERQERALIRNAARLGGLGGGNVRTALQEQAFGRAQTDFDRQIARLGGVAAQGQQAAGRQIGDPAFIQTGPDVGVGSLTPRPGLGPVAVPEASDENPLFGIVGATPIGKKAAGFLGF
jgi:hypothetical protein